MAVGLERSEMTRTRGRPRSDRDDVSAKLDRSIVGKAKLIATHRGVPAAELMSKLLQGPIDKAYAVMIRDLESKDKS